MGTKIEAATQFAKKYGEMSVITFIEDIEATAEGKAGTEIFQVFSQFLSRL